MQGTFLEYDGYCGYKWRKKSGTIYYFYAPTAMTCSGGTTLQAGFFGRLNQIIARNHNNNITFNYFWNASGATSGANLTEIDAVHSDGQQLTLTFAAFSGRTLLWKVTRPDGQYVQFDYDSNGELSDACEIGNGNSDPSGAPYCGDTSHNHHGYGWSNGQLTVSDSPRWRMNSDGGLQTNGTGGGYAEFSYVANTNNVYQVQDGGYVNFTPSGDGVGAVLQSGPSTSPYAWRTIHFAYPNGGETQLTDTDGHETNWFYNSVGSVTETQNLNYVNSTCCWLTSYAQWDSNNNLTASQDPRSGSASDTTYETDYAYDAHGNVVAKALPKIGTYRPTSLYSYDTYNNITAYCDPNYTHQLNKDWTTNPGTSDSLCPTTQGTVSSPAATVYTWSTTDYNSDEPYGRLTNTYTPMGYHAQLYYASGPQGGTDVGLPSKVQGDSIPQTLDNTTRQPTQEFEYDAEGNIVCYAKLVDSAEHW